MADETTTDPTAGTTSPTTTTTEAASAGSSAASDVSGGAATDATETGAAAGHAPKIETGTEGAPAGAAAPTVPETYDLKVPDGATFDADFVTRTAATARALGLTNEGGQKLLDAQIAEIGTARDAAATAAKAEQLAAMQPGGTIWKEQEAKWAKDALADTEVGGSPEKLQANVELAKKVVTRFAPDDAKKFFEDTGLRSHPALIRMLSRIGKLMSEATLAGTGTRTSAAPLTEDERLAKRYPTMAGKS